MDNNENNTIIDNIIDCNKQAYSILYALNEDKPFVSECTNEIKERNLLSEARRRNFKTPEEGEAFLLYSTSPTGSENHPSPLRFQTFNKKVF